MAKNYIAEGKRATVSNYGSVINSGQAVVLASSMVAVALEDISATGSGTLALEGVFALPKATGAISLGQRLYWDADGNPVGGVAGSGALTTTATGNIPAGFAYQAAGSSDATAQVRIGAPWTAVETTAAEVAITDTGGLFTGGHVEDALAELGNNKFSVPVPLGAITMEDGTALTKQATTVAGYAQLSDKEQVILIPVNCTAGENLALSVPLPLGVDITKDLTVHVLAGKDANNDALTLDCEVYPVGVADGGNADIQDTAAQTITQAIGEIVFTAGADGLLASPSAVTIVLALGGTNDGDAVRIYGVRVDGSRKNQAAA